MTDLDSGFESLFIHGNAHYVCETGKTFIKYLTYLGDPIRIDTTLHTEYLMVNYCSWLGSLIRTIFEVCVAVTLCGLAVDHSITGDWGMEALTEEFGVFITTSFQNWQNKVVDKISRFYMYNC